MPFGDPNETAVLFLELQRPGATLVINLKQVTAVDTPLGPFSTAAGDLFEGGTVRFFDQNVPTQRLIYEDKLKSVFYGHIGDEITVGHLAFFIGLNGDRDTKFKDVNLASTIVVEVSQILATFQLLEGAQ